MSFQPSEREKERVTMYPMSTRLLIFDSKLTEMVLPLYVCRLSSRLKESSSCLCLPELPVTLFVLAVSAVEARDEVVCKWGKWERGAETSWSGGQY